MLSSTWMILNHEMLEEALSHEFQVSGLSGLIYSFLIWLNMEPSLTDFDGVDSESWARVASQMSSN